MFHLALHISTEARSRWRGLLLIFVAFFDFGATRSFYVSGYVSPLSTIPSTNLDGGTSLRQLPSLLSQ